MSREFFMHVNNHANRKSFRNMTSRERKKMQPSFTVAGILEGNTFRFGIAKCSKEDSFCKEKGRNLALGYALQQKPQKIPPYVLEKGTIGNYFVNKAKKLIKK